MNGQENNQQAGERVYERCLCREAVDRLRGVFHVPDDVRQHLTNSRIEFLKAIRAAIDDRISHLSRGGQQGTKVTVE